MFRTSRFHEVNNNLPRVIDVTPVTVILMLLAWFGIVFPPQLSADEPAPFVYKQEGGHPIILSAPHGGKLELPEVPLRNGEGLKRGPGKFVTSRDTGTEELAQELSAAIMRKFGQKPYLVLMRAHRKFLDPNRTPELGYEAPKAQSVYNDYHTTLASYCQDVQKRFRHGLLLDLHGQGSAADTVFRGTQNGKTVALLRERFGEAAHTGETSLFGLLKTRGWNVFPDPFDGGEQAGYTGGYIVQTYGGLRGPGIDAIQLEFGLNFRTKENRSKTADALADALAEYAKLYLDALPRPNAAANGPEIRIGIYRGAGAGGSRDNLMRTLQKQPKFKVVDLTVDDIRRGAWANCQVLIHPGGSGGSQGKALGEAGREKVREFVKQGGGYVGICAGAYLATRDYDWSLNILDAKVIDRQHWNRGFGMVDLSLTSRGREIMGLDSERVSIYYHQGPLLAPADDPDISDYENLAKFETEIAKNGAPSGIMPGTTAIASGRYHQGRVFCFSPHPERTDGLESILNQAIMWAAGSP
jgi:hypothetical protein